MIIEFYELIESSAYYVVSIYTNKTHQRGTYNLMGPTNCSRPIEPILKGCKNLVVRNAYVAVCCSVL